MPMRHRYYQALGPHGLHRVHYTEWGDPDNPKALVCVHGLTRTGRDFDFLAAALADEYRVFCPDVVGRGQSAWLPHSTDYTYPLYISDMVTLLARIDAEQIDFVGTSMGGLIGILLASYANAPLRKLVVNDVGPRVPAAGMQRIADYVGQVVAYESIEKMEALMRKVGASFGKLTDGQWRHMTIHSARKLEDGRYALAYDPGIADNFRNMALQDVDLWKEWDAVRCPTLLLRGAYSDVLDHADAVAMTERGPRAQLVEFAGMGHAPALMDEEQIAVVRDWLLAENNA